MAATQPGPVPKAYPLAVWAAISCELSRFAQDGHLQHGGFELLLPTQLSSGVQSSSSGGPNPAGDQVLESFAGSRGRPQAIQNRPIRQLSLARLLVLSPMGSNPLQADDRGGGAPEPVGLHLWRAERGLQCGHQNSGPRHHNVRGPAQWTQHRQGHFEDPAKGPMGLTQKCGSLLPPCSSTAFAQKDFSGM